MKNFIDEIIDIFEWLKNRKEIQKQMVLDEKQFNNTLVELNRAKKKIAELETEIHLILSEKQK